MSLNDHGGRPRLIVGIIVAVAAMFSTANAQECVVTTSDAEADAGLPGVGRYYAGLDSCVLAPCISDVFVYEEANGLDGLQRADDVHDDTCNGLVPADRLVLLYGLI